MSPVVQQIVRLVNRNLQHTLLAGAVALVLLFELFGLGQNAMSTYGPLEVFKLLIVLGLPSMLVIQGGRKRPRMDRVFARATATFLCSVVLLHSLFAPSAALPMIVTAGMVVMAQISIMRTLEARGEACTK